MAWIAEWGDQSTQMFVEMEEGWCGHEVFMDQPRRGTKEPARSLEDLHYTISLAHESAVKYKHIAVSISKRSL